MYARCDVWASQDGPRGPGRAVGSAQGVDSAISSETKPVSNVPKVPVVPKVCPESIEGACP
jgi:hypothetical protein